MSSLLNQGSSQAGNNNDNTNFVDDFWSYLKQPWQTSKTAENSSKSSMNKMLIYFLVALFIIAFVYMCYKWFTKTNVKNFQNDNPSSENYPSVSNSENYSSGLNSKNYQGGSNSENYENRSMLHLQNYPPMEISNHENRQPRFQNLRMAGTGILKPENHQDNFRNAAPKFNKQVKFNDNNVYIPNNTINKSEKSLDNSSNNEINNEIIYNNNNEYDTEIKNDVENKYNSFAPPNNVRYRTASSEKSLSHSSSVSRMQNQKDDIENLSLQFKDLERRMTRSYH